MKAFALLFFVYAGPSAPGAETLLQGLTFMSLERCDTVGRHMRAVLEMSQPGDGTSVLYVCREVDAPGAPAAAVVVPRTDPEDEEGF